VDTGGMWSPLQALGSGGNVPEAATDGAGTWLVVWNSGTINPGAYWADQDVFFSRSENDGVVWSAPAPVNTDAAGDLRADIEPSVATDRSGNWIVAWSTDYRPGMHGIMIATSSTAGRSWTAPNLVSTGGTPSTTYNGAQVATDGAGTWMVVWSTFDESTNPTTFGIYLVQSNDNGAHWTAQMTVDYTLRGEDDVPRIATDRAGNWIVSWQSSDPGPDDDIYVIRSTNGGAMWSAREALNSDAAMDTANDAVAQIIYEPGGSMLAVWARGDTTNSQILYARSYDHGGIWTPPASIAGHSPMQVDTWPWAASDASGNTIVVWQSKGAFGGALGTDYDLLYVVGR
jgi:hypothetical protein